MLAKDTLRQAFFELRTLGFSPIPVRCGPVRKPCIKDWQRFCMQAATDQEIDYWSQTFMDCNIAVCGGYGGLICCDIDEPELIGDLGKILPNETLIKRGSKGISAFYRSKNPVSLVMGEIAANGSRRACVEFLGIGRNATVPPSYHYAAGKPYEWLTPLRRVQDLPLLSDEVLPAAHAVLVRRYGQGAVYGGQRPIEADRPVALTPAGKPDGRMLAWAAAALQGEAARVEATGKGGRANQLFASACALGKYLWHGLLTADQIIGAMLAACDTNGLLHEETAQSIAAQCWSGFNKASADPLPALGPTAAEAFGPPSSGVVLALAPSPSTPAAPPPAASSMKHWRDDGAIDPPRRELIQGMIIDEPGNVTLFAGQSGVGKSHNAVAINAVIASGIDDFMGFKNRNKGSGEFVVYICNEGQGTIKERLYAFKKECGFPERSLPFVVITDVDPLVGDGWRKVLTVIQFYQAIFKKRVRLITIDSLASCAGGEIDHNDAGSAVTAMKSLHDFSMAAGCPLLVIAHFGKVIETGIAGSHQWKAQCDNAIYALGERDEANGAVANRRLVLGKSKTGVEGLLCHFELKTVTLGVNLYDEPRTTVIPIRCEPEKRSDSVDMDKGDATLIAAFGLSMREGTRIHIIDVPEIGDRYGYPLEDVRRRFSMLYDGTPDGQRSAWKRINKKLLIGDHDRFMLINNHIIDRVTGVS